MEKFSTDYWYLRAYEQKVNQTFFVIMTFFLTPKARINQNTHLKDKAKSLIETNAVVPLSKNKSNKYKYYIFIISNLITTKTIKIINRIDKNVANILNSKRRRECIRLTVMCILYFYLLTNFVADILNRLWSLRNGF